MTAKRASEGKRPKGPRWESIDLGFALRARPKILPSPMLMCSPITWPPRSTSTVPRTAAVSPRTTPPCCTVVEPKILTASPWTTLPGSTSIEPPTLTTSPWTTVPCGTTRSPLNTCTMS